MDVIVPSPANAVSESEAAVARPDVIRAEDLTKRFGDVTALDSVSFQILKGEFVAIMGPSGSGKTTLLNIISCLDSPTEGRLFLDGLETSSLSERERTRVRREKIGLVFQQFHLIPYLNALENVMLAQHYHSVTDRDEAAEALEHVGLGPRGHHLPSQLSGGEQQRVCIARALINEPAIILADEPTGNLDEENEKLVVALLKRLHEEEGRTIAMVTHNPELGALAERVIRMQHGRIED